MLRKVIIFGLLSGVPSTTVSAQSYQVRWSDHRALGVVMVAATPGISPTNPRGYVWDKTIDVTTPAGLATFQQRMLSFADNSIQVLKNMNAQGMITWDLEGEQAVQPITYIGDPRQLAKIAPEMDSIADAYFKRFRDAGLKVGVCLRPQQIQLDANNVPVAQNNLANDTDIANLLISKISYARQRWGASIFYVDSNVYANGAGVSASIFQTVLNTFPDILLISEHHETTSYWAYSAGYSDLRWAGAPGVSSLGSFVRTPDAVKASFPQAFSVTNASTGNLTALFLELVKAVQAGDILLFNGWWDEQPTNGMVKQIYAAAGSYVPPVASKPSVRPAATAVH